MSQDELSEKNTSLQEAEYDLQKRNHRVERLLKRLSEVEKQCKMLPAGVSGEKTVKGEQALNTGEVTYHCSFFRPLHIVCPTQAHFELLQSTNKQR